MPATSSADHNPKTEAVKIAQLAVTLALDKKASSPLILNIKSLGACSDYFVILTASNPRQVAAVAESIRSTFKKHLGLQPIQIDGLETCSWVLLDYGFLFIHIFLEDTRAQYGLEQLWAKGLHVPFDEQETHLFLESLINPAESLPEMS